MVLVKKWFDNNCRRANSTGCVSKFPIITSSYAFTSDWRWMRFSIGQRDAACANSTLASYDMGATRELWTGNRAHFSQLAVKEGTPVERNNVRMSYVHSGQEFVLCSSLPVAAISIRTSYRSVLTPISQENDSHRTHSAM